MGERRQVARLHRDMPRSVQRRYSCNGVGCSPTQHDPARPSTTQQGSLLVDPLGGTHFDGLDPAIRCCAHATAAASRSPIRQRATKSKVSRSGGVA